MPALMRDIFIASRTEELSHKEIAARFHISERRVKYELKKALDTLKESFRDYLAGIFPPLGYRPADARLPLNPIEESRPVSASIHSYKAISTSEAPKRASAYSSGTRWKHLAASLCRDRRTIRARTVCRRAAGACRSPFISGSFTSARVRPPAMEKQRNGRKAGQ